MKIDSQRIDAERPGIESASNERSPARLGSDTSAKVGGEVEDPVEFSSEARRLAGVMADLKDIESVDQPRIAELREAVQAGTYSPDPQRLAQALLRRIAEDEGVG